MSVFGPVPMPLPDCWCWLLAMSAIHPSCKLPSCSPPRSSDWSVVFVFNALLSALAPLSPIRLPACLWCLLAMSAIRPSSSLLAHKTDPVTGVLCLSSMHRSVLLLLLLQCRCLLVCVVCWQCLQFIHLPNFLLAHIPDAVIGVLCLSSMPHSVLLIPLFQSFCLFCYLSSYAANA